MADDLKPAPGALPDGALRDPSVPTNKPATQPGFSQAALTPPPAPAQPSQGRTMRRMWLLIAALAALALFLGWRAYFYEEEGDPVGSAMLAFEKQNSLIVFASRFEVVAESEYEQTIATVPVRRVRQAMIVPASVDYRLDLSAIGRGDFSWDEASQTLTVTLPQLQTSRPNIDEGAARLFTEGLLNTAGSQQLLSEKNSQVAEEKAAAFAKNPEVLELARVAAAEAVRQNLAVPLQVAGFESARVEVRFEPAAVP